MSIAEALLSSTSDEWSTPQDLFDRLDGIYSFTFDPCCTRENAKTAIFCTSTEDGLSQNWGNHRVFLNPPYSKISDWMKKAYESSQEGALVVCLVPARTDTRWWWNYARRGDIKFLKGRLKFGGSKNSAPFPSAIVIFYPKDLGF